MDQPEDMWAWAHEQPDQSPPEVDASQVLAVLVAHNGEQWLGRTLVALARLETQPGRLVAVDAESTDGSRALLEKGKADGLLHSVLDGRGAEGFGANVALAVANATADTDFEPRFIWLLHDDSAPSRRALTELLLAAQRPSKGDQLPAILVPKLLHPKRRNHPDQMSAVGESIAPSGARVLTVEPGDIDQHQLEATRVLGASTAGMFITMDAWRALDGLDAGVPLFRDGVELGWRANAQGLVVRTCPQASLRHVEAGRVGLRKSTLAPDSSQADQSAGMAVVVMHSKNPQRTIARISLQSLFTAGGYLLGKSPSLARAQLRAAAAIRADRARLVETAQRYATAQVGQVPDGLLPDRGWGVRRFFERIAATISDQYYDIVDDDGGMLDELTGDDFAGGRRRTRFLSPTIIGMLVMLVLSLLASRKLMHFGLLSGPALLPAPGGLGQAWANWAQADPGLVGANAPWLGLMALGSTLALGQPDWFATLLALGGPALAGWSAFHLVRQITGPGWWTPMLACLWGVLLPLLGVTGSGALDLTTLAIALPIGGLLVRRWLVAPTTGVESWQAPAAIALLVGLLASSMPWVWLVGVAVAGYVGVRTRHWPGAALAVLGPVIWLVPWIPRLLADPGRLLVGADPAAQPAGTAPHTWQVLIGAAQQPAAPSYLGALAIGLIWVVGLVGAARSRELSNEHRVGLLVLALVPPVFAVLVTRIVITVAGVAVRPDPNGWLLFGLFGLILLAAHGIGRRHERSVDDSPEDLSQRAAALRVRSALGITLSIALALGAAWWLIGGTRSLSRGAENMPTYVSGVMASERATRTLMVDLSSGTAQFNLVSAATPSWGSAEQPLLSIDEQAQDELWQAAQQIAQGQPSDDLAERLTRLGVGHVWLRGATTEAANNLSATPQLDVAPADETTMVYTVTSQPSRAMLRLPDTALDQPIADGQIEQSSQNGLVVLSAPADDNWRAFIDGEALPRADSGDWRQAWATEGRTGELSYRLGVDVFGVLWAVVIGLALLVLIAPTAQKSHSPRRALASASGRRGGRS